MSAIADVPPQGGTPGILDGLTVTCDQRSAAADVVLSHLVAMGCRQVDEHAGRDRSVTPPCATGTGRLRLGRAGDNSAGELNCDISWAGPVDEAMVDEPTVQAACGIMHVHGRKSGRPEPIGVDFATTVAGLLATQGVLAALIGRSRGRKFTQVTTSVAQGALLCMSQYLAAATADDDWAEPLLPGGPPFNTSDAIGFEIETFEPSAWLEFWTLLGADRGAISRGWRPFVHRYATATSPLPEELGSAAQRHSFATAVAAAATAGISLVQVHGVAGRSKEIARAVGPCPWRVTPRQMDQPAPPLPGLSDQAGAPLEGLIVVEACRRIQGPLAAHVLRMLGARVIRVEPPGGDPLRAMPPIAGDCSARFMAINRGKEAVEIDIKSRAGRQSIRDLVAGADVFLHNWAPGKARQLGLEHGDLRSVRPALVYAYASGWGDLAGPDPPMGTDFLVQAYSGLAAMLRPAGEPPAPSLMTLTDVVGGIVSAGGVLAGLLAREATGCAQRVDSSLLSAAAALQQPVVDALAGGGTADRRHGRPIWTALQRPLLASDGWVMLAAGAQAAPAAVASALGRDGRGRPPDIEDIEALVRRQSARSSVEALRIAGLAAVEVCTDLAELASDRRFARAVRRDLCATAGVPWEFLTVNGAWTGP